MERLGLSFKRFTPSVLVLCCIALPILLFSLMYQNLNFNLSLEFSKAKVLKELAHNATLLQVLEKSAQNNASSSADVAGSRNRSVAVSNSSSSSSSSSSASSQSTGNSSDQLFGGLVATRFDQYSCLSRYQSHLYRKASSHKPSPYLISKLRSYEDLHRRCGPQTKAYIRTLRELKSSHVKGPTMCNYIVWIAANGLGNRMISIASTFLYAVLTDRVLLVDFRTDMTGLFCEPFPNSTWLLPNDFPHKKHQGEVQSYGIFLKANTPKSLKASTPSFLYVNIQPRRDDGNTIFHCNHSQALLQQVPALVMKSDQYFAPYLFAIPSFKKELMKMFPEKEEIFYHLGHYLFHPSNDAWGLITRFYKAYLGGADERVGLQIRVFNPKRTPDKTITDQILACTLKHNILPEIDERKTTTSASKKQTSKAVLVTSLHSNYTENLRAMYWRAATRTGEIVGVHQPSHEEYQKRSDNAHNMKAWTEMYLLSLCDVLVTSGHSTFGYVAQGLGGLKPWVLHKANSKKTPDPPCKAGVSMEPCFHYPPKHDNCSAKTELDVGSLIRYLRPCEDSSRGVKLVNGH